MDREALKGCGCLVGLMAALAAIGAVGLLAVTAVIGLLGWPIALAIAALMAAAAGVLIWLAIKFIADHMHRSKLAKPLAPYRSKLAEIDKLMADVEARYARIAGGADASWDIRSKVAELKRRKDEIVEGLLEMDEFLRAPGNDARKIAVEETMAKVRGTPENAARLRGVAEGLKKVKADRLALIANLDRIAIGLRELRTRLLSPLASAPQISKGIDDELASIAQGVEIAEKARKEIAELELDAADPGRRLREPPKLTR